MGEAFSVRRSVSPSEREFSSRTLVAGVEVRTRRIADLTNDDHDIARRRGVAGVGTAIRRARRRSTRAEQKKEREAHPDDSNATSLEHGRCEVSSHGSPYEKRESATSTGSRLASGTGGAISKTPRSRRVRVRLRRGRRTRARRRAARRRHEMPLVAGRPTLSQLRELSSRFS